MTTILTAATVWLVGVFLARLIHGANRQRVIVPRFCGICGRRLLAGQWTICSPCERELLERSRNRRVS